MADYGESWEDGWWEVGGFATEEGSEDVGSYEQQEGNVYIRNLHP